MVAVSDTFAQWLAQARIREHALTPEQRGVLQAAFLFRRRCGADYYSTRLLSHFLLHCDTDLKVAQIARLVGISRPTASRQQGLSSKEALRQAHHRMDGRPYGKLLPRYAGPIAHFLHSHPQASRADLIDFIDQTFQVRVSRVALYKFLKKYGLDQVAAAAPAAPAPPPAVAATPAATTATSPPPAAVPAVPPAALAPLAALPAAPPAPPFCPGAFSAAAPLFPS